jgi:hypothetical protein
MLASGSASDQVMGGLWVLAGIVLLLVLLARDRRRAPNLPCRACGGRGVRSAWRANASGPCPKCNGKPRQRRW